MGTIVVQNRMSFFSDALGHSAFTGVAIGALAGLADSTWAAVAFAVVFALVFSVIRQKSTMKTDTIIGVLSSAAMALGIFLSTLGGQNFSKFNSLLIGDILSVKPSRIALLFVILLLVLALWLWQFNALLLSSVHPQLARSRGINTFWSTALFTCAVAVLVALCMTWIGLLVINSLLVLPAALSRNLARNQAQYHLISILAALLCGVLGLFGSYYLGTSAGATMTLALALLFFLSLPLRRHKGQA